MRDGKMDQIFYDAVGSNPIIAAVKSMEDIEKCCAIEEIQVIFIFSIYSITFCIIFQKKERD